jgi:hypothetical protein
MVVGRVRGARPLWSNIAPLRRPASRAPARSTRHMRAAQRRLQGPAPPPSRRHLAAHHHAQATVTGSLLFTGEFNSLTRPHSGAGNGLLLAALDSPGRLLLLRVVLSSRLLHADHVKQATAEGEPACRASNYASGPALGRCCTADTQ